MVRELRLDREFQRQWLPRSTSLTRKRSAHTRRFAGAYMLPSRPGKRRPFPARTYRAFERRARSSDGGFKHCNAGRRVAGHLKGSRRNPQPVFAHFIAVLGFLVGLAGLLGGSTSGHWADQGYHSNHGGWQRGDSRLKSPVWRAKTK